MNYVVDLGKIVGNLHSLEFSLRAFLFHEKKEPGGEGFDTMEVGDEVEENSFTNYSQMRQLIREYNVAIGGRDPSLVIPEDEIVELRDALAHGRVYARSKAELFRLLKFSKAHGGKVTVTVAETMTPEWRERKRRLLFDALERVGKAGATHGFAMEDP
jgi:hypothetical protein